MNIPHKLAEYLKVVDTLKKGGSVPCKCGGRVKMINDGVIMCESCGRGSIPSIIMKRTI